MRKYLERKLFLWSVIAVFASCANMYASHGGLFFSNRESSFVLQNVGSVDSKMWLKPTPVLGWLDGSILKDADPQNFNLITHTVPDSGSNLVTPATAPGRLLYNNSNAIVYGLKNNSNALSYGIKNNSNAFVYCCKNTSNAFNHAIRIYETHQIYSSNAVEENYVYYKDGFTIQDGVILTLQTPIPAMGNINLSNPGILSLSGDFYLGSNAYLTSGGIIDGNGYSLVMSCSFAIPENQYLRFTSDTTINGHGSTLFLDPHARLIVDCGVTLTIKNVRIKNMRNDVNNPIIRLMGYNSRVALQDVELALADDFEFRKGQLFIHDDVIVTGSSVFSYRSTKPGYIADAGTFGFDKGTTFFYHPNTNDNNLIKLQSKTAAMYFDGATLQTTHTGLRLSHGRLFFDNKVTLSTASNTLLSSLSLADSKDMGYGVLSVDWSNDGKYVAVGIGTGVISELRVYSFNGTFFGSYVGKDFTNVDVNAVAWSADDKYLAVGAQYHATEKELTVYSFDKTAFTLTEKDYINFGFDVKSVDWNPCGSSMLAIGLQKDEGTGNDEVRVYPFDGSSLGTTFSGINVDNHVNSVKWSPDGGYIAFVTSTSGGDEVRIHSVTGSTVSGSAVGVAEISVVVRALSWSPDGKHIAIGAESGATKEVHVYRFDGASLVNLDVLTNDDININAVQWSPDGQYLAVGRASTGGNDVLIYQFDGVSTLTLVSTAQIDTLGSNVNSLAWSPAGTHLVIGTSAIGTADELLVYQVNYRFDTTMQGFGNGLIFGNSAQTDGDLETFVLGGAHVILNGIAYYDNVN